MRPFFAALLALSLAATSHAATIINGDFETGTFTGWSTGATGATITSPGLSGTYSATLPGISGGGNLAQTLGGNATYLALSFSMPDPGGPGDRGFNIFVGQSSSSSQLNIRVVDLNDDGVGDVQIFDSAPNNSWQTIAALVGSVSFTGTNSFVLRFNGFGSPGLNYDLTINGITAYGLSFRQNGSPTQFNLITFSNQFGTSPFTVDNIVVPEPSRALLLLVSLSALTSLHRRRLPSP